MTGDMNKYSSDQAEAVLADTASAFPQSITLRRPWNVCYARSRTGSTALATVLLERRRLMFRLLSLAIIG